MIKENKFYKHSTNYKPLQNNYVSNNVYDKKSHSLNKYTVSMDKDQILKEFYLYKLNSSNATSKSNKNYKLNKSFTKSSKSKTSREKLLIPVRSVKGGKQYSDNLSYNTTKNKRNNHLEQFNYNDLCRTIEHKNPKQTKRSEDNRINIKQIGDRNKNKQGIKSNANKFNIMDLLKPSNNIKQIKNNNNINLVQNEKDTDSQKNGNIRTCTSGYLNSSNPNLLNTKNTNGNFEKYLNYLNEKITYLKNKIKQDLTERDKLISILKDQKTPEQIQTEEKLQSKINNYKKMKQNLMSTSSLLNQEINQIKKEIQKYSSTSVTTDYSTNSVYSHNYHLNATAKENKNKRIDLGSPMMLSYK